jgi:hypothetical protein
LHFGSQQLAKTGNLWIGSNRRIQKLAVFHVETPFTINNSLEFVQCLSVRADSNKREKREGNTMAKAALKTKVKAKAKKKPMKRVAKKRATKRR